MRPAKDDLFRIKMRRGEAEYRQPSSKAAIQSRAKMQQVAHHGVEVLAGAEIFVVDDDPAICDALSIALRSAGYGVACFPDAAALLNAMRTRTPAMILLDVMLPDLSGIDVLRKLRSEGHVMPVLLITGHGDIPMAVEAIKLGAYDFVEKPFSMDMLLHQLKAAMSTVGSLEGTASTEDDLENLGGSILTRRERQVLREIAAGASSREAGRILSISPRTVEVHRAHIMNKLGARNAADLMRIIFSHGSQELL